MNRNMQLTPEQVRATAAEGLKLINDDSRVSLPPSMAANGSFVMLNGILKALANGELVLGNPIPPQVDGPKPPSPPEDPPANDDDKGEGEVVASTD